MHSLQLRLGIALCASLAGLISLQWVIVSTAGQVLAEDYIATRLEHDTDSLLNVLGFDEKGLPYVDAAQIGPIYRQPYSGHYYRITHAGDVLRSRSLWDHDLPGMVAPGLGEVVRAVADGPQNQKLLVLAGTYKKRDALYTIEIAEDMSPVVSAIERFEGKYTMVALTLLAILIMIQITIVRVTLKPLDRVRRDVLRLERGEVEKLHEEVPREISPLVHEINELLHVMSMRLVRSRNALGNLAHALKTPLTVLTQFAEDEQMRALPELRQSLLEQTDTMRGLMERELKRARIAGAASPGEIFQPRREIEFLLEILHQVYAGKRLQVDHTVPAGLGYVADREDMLELMGNLLDNACKWAKCHVFVEFSREPGLHFFVEDDGPGCSSAELAKLAQRGVRIDEQTPGYGLGLAIVKDIVEMYQGTIEFGRSQRYGGFRAAVTLPPREQPPVDKTEAPV